MARSRMPSETLHKPVRPMRLLPSARYDDCRKDDLDPPMTCACYCCHPEVWCTACVSERKAVDNGYLTLDATSLQNGNPRPAGVYRDRGKTIGDRTLCQKHNAKKYASAQDIDSLFRKKASEPSLFVTEPKQRGPEVRQ
jgi:hypothetical protein